MPPDDQDPHCYWFHNDRQPWEDSSDTCEREGGHLATITSREENQLVHAIITNFGEGYVSLGGTDGKDPDDADGPGTYRWVTGEPFVFTNWAERGPQGSREPDGFCDRCGNESCQCDHRLAMTRDGTWNDRWEENPRPFVCEADTKR